MTSIQRYDIEEVYIVMEDKKGVSIEQAVGKMLNIETLLFPIC